MYVRIQWLAMLIPTRCTIYVVLACVSVLYVKHCKVGIVLSLCMYVRTYVCTLSQSSILCTALILCA